MADNEPAPEETDSSKYVVSADPKLLAASSGARVAGPSNGPLKPDSLSTDYVVVAQPEEVPAETAVLPETDSLSDAAVPLGTAAEPMAATTVSAGATPSGVSQVDESRVVYVTPPVAPKAAGNRAFGVLVAMGATVIYAVLFAFAALLILRAIRGFATMTMLANFGFWIPVGVFVVALIIVVLVVNRAGVWAHIIGSFLIAAAVYIVGSLLITAVSVVVLHQAATVTGAFASPTMIAAAVIAREVALWAGVIVSFRGKRVTVRNRDAREAFDAVDQPGS